MSIDSTVKVTLPQRKMCLSSSNNIRPIPKLLSRGISAPIPLQKAISKATSSLRICYESIFLNHLPEERRSQEAIKDNSIYRSTQLRTAVIQIVLYYEPILLILLLLG